MTDDIPIYISPEDDVTSVRERLEKAPNRQVTMVIPAQTQLRSLVAWRVLHADARRMGKDVLVISTDPQIRSLAQAGKFRVAHSQASSMTGKSRPPTRPGRVTGAGKSKLTPSQARMQVAKKPSTQLPITNESNTGDAPRNADPLSHWYGPLPARSSSMQRDTESPFTATTTGNLKGKSTFSHSLDETKQEPGQIYDLHPNTPPSLRQIQPNVQQEEVASYWADDVDYKRAEDIRNSAHQHAVSQASSHAIPRLPQTPPETAYPAEQQSANTSMQGSIYKTTPLTQAPAEKEVPSTDFYPVMDDAIPSSSLSEQHGSAVINGLDIGEHALHDDYFEEPIDEIDGGLHVEDLGEDTGTNVNLFDVQSILEDTPHHSWSEPEGQEQQESAGAARVYKPNGPRNSRRENREYIAPSPQQQDLDNPVDLPPIEEQPTIIMTPKERSPTPRGRPRNSMALDIPNTPSENKKSTGKRASQQILGPTPRGVTTARPRTNNIPARAATNAGTQRTNVGGTGRRVATKKLPEPTSRRSGAVLLLLAILLLLLIGIPAFFLPTADVTLKLPAKNYVHALTLKAVANNPKGSAADIVPADQLTNDFEATGAGKATSSAKVGTAPATGTVTFTNNGKTLVTIPSGTVVTTNSGTSFSTQAEAVVDTVNSNTGGTVDVPVQAQKSGTSGNVASGSINAIPPDGLNAIAMANKMNGSDLKLTVTNKDATTSGGAGNTPAVAQQDVDAAKAALHTTLENTFKAWLATKTFPGDQAGTVTTTETLENAPSVGQTVTDGTFTAKLKLSVVVLIVRTATLQHAAVVQLERFVKQDKAFPNYTVVDDAKHLVQVQQLKMTSDNKSTITLAFTAAGNIVPAINLPNVQSSINGKSIKDAQSILLKIPGVRQADISTAPHIGNWTPNWVPFWSAHITVHLVPEDAITPPKKK
ncbi:MAG: hypothetical protein NVS4B1_07520 [Ktedonobacteraceae bacterium]